MELSKKSVAAAGKSSGLGRCRHFFWLGVVFDTVGAAVLLTGAFADLLFYDMLLYLGAIIIFISLLWWISWYTGNIELLPDDDDDAAAAAAVPLRAASTAAGLRAFCSPAVTTPPTATMPPPPLPPGRPTSGPLGGASFLPLRGRRRVRRVVQRAALPGPDGGHPRAASGEKPAAAAAAPQGVPGPARPSPGSLAPPGDPPGPPLSVPGWTPVPEAPSSRALGSETSDSYQVSAAAASHPPLVLVESHSRLPGAQPSPGPPLGLVVSQRDPQVLRPAPSQYCPCSLPSLSMTTTTTTTVRELRVAPSIPDLQAVLNVHRGSQNIPLFQDVSPKTTTHGDATEFHGQEKATLSLVRSGLQPSERPLRLLPSKCLWEEKASTHH